MKHRLMVPIVLCLCLTLGACGLSAEGPVPLTQAEIDRANDAFAAMVQEGGTVRAAPWNGFFLSAYDDVTELDFAAFLSYCPGDGYLEDADQEEFAALAALPGAFFAEAYASGRWTSPSDLPVPVHRILRSSVDATLEEWAGVTTEDLQSTDGVLYLEDYDAYYTFTSDFGPGEFLCAGGESDGETARLWTETAGDGTRWEVVFQRDGEDWHLRSHRQTTPPETGSPGPSPAAGTDPVWGEQVFQRNYAGEESHAETPEGVVVSLRFVMPLIENAGDNAVWQSLNETFAAQWEAWLQQGREYWGVPGLEPGGDYAVESGFTVQRCDNLLSLRYERREQLAGEPAVTVSGALYDLETGSALTLEDLFQVPVEEFRPALLDLLEEASGPDGSGRTYDAETFTTDGFYLTETDLVLLFPVWEGEAVSPTATLERPISLEALRDLPAPMAMRTEQSRKP